MVGPGVERDSDEERHAPGGAVARSAGVATSGPAAGLGLAAAAATARPRPAADWPETFVAFDCETTGLDCRRDALLQLAAVRVGPEGEHSWSTLIDSGRPVGLQVVRLTGITPERLRGAPTAAEALDAFRGFVADLPLVAHNADFDLGFVTEGLRRARLRPLAAPVYDTLALARLLEPAAASHRLEELAQGRGIPLDRAHDALADARAAAGLFRAYLQDLASLDPLLLGTLAHILAAIPGPLAALVRRAAGDRRVPALVRRGGGAAAPDPRGGGGGAAAPDPRGGGGGAAAPDPRGGGGGAAAAAGDLAALLQPDSPLARRLRPFEVRPGQAAMLHAVAHALASDRHLLVEAGTGTGKSLAYLLPALAWAGGQRRRVVVATHTVNLQEQLVGKDLPLITESGALPGTVALVKGRSQYACLKLWEERLGQPGQEMEPGEAPFLARVASWLARTETGDRGELALYGEDEERFSALSADAVACTGRRCPHFEACFLYRARRAAERADVVVVNHALLFANLRSEVLPDYDYLICDEAHHLEDEASQHLGRVVGERAGERFFRLLERGGERTAGAGRPGGLLPLLRAQWGGGSLGLVPLAPSDRASKVSARLEEAATALSLARDAATACFDGLRAWVQARPRAYARAAVRFEPRPGAGEDPTWDALGAEGERWVLGLGDLAQALSGAAAAMEDDHDAAGGGERVAELQGLAAQASDLADSVRLCLRGAEGWVTWCEVAEARDGPGAVVLRACPIDPGEILARDLFGSKRSVILASATLTVRGSFDYLRGRLGLAQGEQARRTDEVSVESPFAFRRQALIGVPRNAPRPTGPDAARYAPTVAPWLLRLLLASRGHALVLCTSHRLLRELRALLQPALEAEGIACLAQGVDGSRTALTAALRRGDETVVLGSASFWEGVDVQGDALRCLVITQLPFWPPDAPLQQARQEAVAARGGNPFRELQLPAAVLRFKQGFGRLIRSSADRGVAVVLDPRLATAEYGSAFLRSLPGPEVIQGSGEDVLAGLAAWLGVEAPPRRP